MNYTRVLVGCCLLCVSCDFWPAKSELPAKAASIDVLKMVEETNAIIDEVKKPLPNLGTFLHNRDDPRLSDLIMIGENHVDERGLKDSVRALLLLAKKGDVVLLEGNDPIKNGQQDCDYLIFRIYVIQKWNQLKKPYDPIEVSRLEDTLLAPWSKAQSSFAMKSLKLSDLICDFWDDRAAFSITPLLASAEQRNASMAAQIQKHIGRHRVFVFAGLRHLPMGDLMSFQEAVRNDAQRRSWYGLSVMSLDNLKTGDFYKLISAAKKRADPEEEIFRQMHAFGATLKLDSILTAHASSELIPRNLAHNLRTCNSLTCD